MVANLPIDQVSLFLEKVREDVAKLKGGKAAAVCNIRVELLKTGGKAMALGLHAVLTGMWQSGAFPPDWKRGLVIPIWKWKDHWDCSKY